MHILESEQEQETENLKYLVVCLPEYFCYNQAETYPSPVMQEWHQRGGGVASKGGAEG
jgi:hypothetical protein